MREIYLSGVVLVMTALSAFSADKDPKALIEAMSRETGRYAQLQALKDVEYTYVYHNPKSGKKDVSIERYLFDGERSWAEYREHTHSVFPDKSGLVTQGWDGKEAWVLLDGKRVEDPKAVAMGRFLRRTNFYWFAMMQKLLDPGIRYTHKGTRVENKVTYDLVEISFATGVGDVADTYLLYVNPKTKLVDRFLFTVMAFNMTEPFVMDVEYETVEGLRLPVRRRYAKADWDGKIIDPDWTEEVSTNIKFNNGFSATLFEKKMP